MANICCNPSNNIFGIPSFLTSRIALVVSFMNTSISDVKRHHSFVFSYCTTKEMISHIIYYFPFFDSVSFVAAPFCTLRRFFNPFLTYIPLLKFFFTDNFILLLSIPLLLFYILQEYNNYIYFCLSLLP